MTSHLLFINAKILSGCDMTSATIGQGKANLVKKIHALCNSKKKLAKLVFVNLVVAGKMIPGKFWKWSHK